MEIGLARTRLSDRTRQSTIDRFGGYDHSDSCRDGGIIDMKNMSSDAYPKLGVRPQRVLLKPTGLDIIDILVRDVNTYIAARENDGTASLYLLDGTGKLEKKITGLSGKNLKLVWMQNRLLIFPDGYFFVPESDSASESHGMIADERETTFESLSILLPGEAPNAYGNKFSEAVDGSTKDIAGSYIAICISDVLDADWTTEVVGVDENGEYIYQTWLKVNTPLKRFNPGYTDSDKPIVKLMSSDYTELAELNYDRCAIVINNGQWRRYVLCVYDSSARSLDWDVIRQNAVYVSGGRELPYLSNVFECDNRIWGSWRDRLHASGLGEPGKYTQTTSVSTSPWWCDTGSAGTYTAGVSFGGVPHFFKENRVVKIYGTQPSKYASTELELLGVEPESARSCAFAQGALFYNSKVGICAYTGSMPSVVSAAFGGERYSDAVGGSDGTKYYVSQKDSLGRWRLFCYDTLRGIWHVEDEMHAVAMSSDSGTLYAADSDGRIWIIGRPENPPAYATSEGDFESMVEFGDFFVSTLNAKRLKKIRARLELEAGSSVSIYVKCDNGEYSLARTISAPLSSAHKCYDIPMILPRCDRYRIKLQGYGTWRLSALTQEFTIGSDMNV